jgi:nucleotide-binding universal stress UspA family protein
MKILVAYDGSGCAEAALDDLQRAGLPDDAEALVVSVAEVWLPPPPPSVYEVVEAAESAQTPAELQRDYAKESPPVLEACRLAGRAAERLRQNFPGWKVTAEGLYGSPAREVLRLADEWRPRLIVAGSHGRSALGRLVLGSVSQKVLHEAQASVRIARGRVEVEPRPCRVLVGVDGSRGAEAAVCEVAGRSWPRGSEALAVIVDNEPLDFGFVERLVKPLKEVAEEENREEAKWVKEVLGRAVTRLSAAGLAASAVMKTGDPRRVLVEEAERWGADCVFVGSHRFGGRVERFLLGSVASAVAARAHCSVEVVRAPEEDGSPKGRA